LTNSKKLDNKTPLSTNEPIGTNIDNDNNGNLWQMAEAARYGIGIVIA